jgi:hypothetical protein
MAIPRLSDFTTTLPLFRALTELGYTRAPADRRVDPRDPDRCFRPDMRPLRPCWSSGDDETLVETGRKTLQIFPLTGEADLDGFAYLYAWHDADGRIDHLTWELVGEFPPEIPVLPGEVELEHLG